MRIGIDARFVGPQGTGLGKYSEKLILNLAKVDAQNQYRIFLKKDNWDFLVLPKSFRKVQADVSWYSISEQLKMPKIFKNENLDVLHVPHFNVPVFYKGKFVVTIHDLIHHDFKNDAATAHSSLVFQAKRAAYRKVIENAIYKSAKIITPSNFVKDEIVRRFKISSSKVIVTYEAAEEEYSVRQPSTVNRQQFLLYVGNAYPHKNLNRLLDAMQILTTYYKLHTTNLVLVCPRDVFATRLTSEIKKRDLGKRVELKGYLPPKDLSALFQKAQAYVFPSLSEGFGIPGLNAMASGLPLAASNIPVLKEVYGAAALYFNPKDPGDIAQKIETLIESEKLKSDLIKRGKTQIQKYSWKKMAQETLEIYDSIGSSYN